MYRGLIIDFGGVLTTPFEESAKAFCKREGLEPNALRTTLQAHSNQVAEVEHGAMTQQQFEELIGFKLNVFPDNLVERITRAMEPNDVMPHIKQIRKKAKVAILSNSLGSDPYDLYERFHLKVDALIASDRHGMRKPDPEIYVLAARKLGLEPEECVYADDSPKFLEPASALGMTTVHATSPEVTIKALAGYF